jgi:CheY-like chemotaxis protein
VRRLILVVEDDEVLRRPLQRMLEAHGYEVRAVATAEEALAILRDVDVDVVVTDWGLPDMKGPELVSRARAAQPGLPAVLMTGSAASSVARAAGRAGLQGPLMKPFEPEQLLAAVHAALGLVPGAGPPEVVVG